MSVLVILSRLLWLGVLYVSNACDYLCIISVPSYVSSLSTAVVCDAIPLDILVVSFPAYDSDVFPIVFPVYVPVGYTV